MSLLLSGDVKTNPGPMSKAQEELLHNVYAIASKLEAGQRSLLSEMKEMRENQQLLEESVSSLGNRVQQLECAVPSAGCADISRHTEMQLSAMAKELAVLRAKSVDTEARSRKLNLVFFGVADAEEETWAQLQEHVVKLCRDKLNIDVQESSIDRAHRLGKFRPDRCRPIITKFCFFKKKRQYFI